MSLVEDITALGTEAPAVIGGLVQVVRKVGPVLPTVKLILDDPAFPQIVQRIQVLHAIEASKPSTPSTPGVPGAPVGIGLRKAVPILDAVIYARRNPWAPWVAGGLILLVIGGIGFKLGRRAR